MCGSKAEVETFYAYDSHAAGCKDCLKKISDRVTKLLHGMRTENNVFYSHDNLTISIENNDSSVMPKTEELEWVYSISAPDDENLLSYK